MKALSQRRDIFEEALARDLASFVKPLRGVREVDAELTR
jgi:hypothetical protein